MKLRVALVEYLNTFPFYQGLRLIGLDKEWDIHPVSPAHCARLFKEDKVDVSLCPVGALDEMPDHEIIGEYCIGADGAVDTVMLLSTVPLEEINSVRLDPNSRTSNALLQILAKHLWKKDWNFYAGENGQVTEACIMIGDQVFEQKKNYPYHYDLAEAWKALTGLPMVFAVWIANPDVKQSVARKINAAFEAGMQEVLSNNAGLEDWQVDYLVNKISYPFDNGKKLALKQYSEWKKEIKPASSPR